MPSSHVSRTSGVVLITLFIFFTGVGEIVWANSLFSPCVPRAYMQSCASQMAGATLAQIPVVNTPDSLKKKFLNISRFALVRNETSAQGRLLLIQPLNAAAMDSLSRKSKFETTAPLMCVSLSGEQELEFLRSVQQAGTIDLQTEFGEISKKSTIPAASDIQINTVLKVNRTHYLVVEKQMQNGFPRLTLAMIPYFGIGQDTSDSRTILNYDGTFFLGDAFRETIYKIHREGEVETVKNGNIYEITGWRTNAQDEKITTITKMTFTNFRSE